MYSIITVYALPFRVASMPAVRYDLNGGLPTCLWYDSLCVRIIWLLLCLWIYVNLIWYLYLFMFNKSCLSLRLSLQFESIFKRWFSHHINSQVALLTKLGFRWLLIHSSSKSLGCVLIASDDNQIARGVVIKKDESIEDRQWVGIACFELHHKSCQGMLTQVGPHSLSAKNSYLKNSCLPISYDMGLKLLVGSSICQVVLQRYMSNVKVVWLI